MKLKEHKWIIAAVLIPVVLIIWACNYYSRRTNMTPGDTIDSLYENNRIITKEIDNGLQILILENNSAPVVSLKYYVKTGSVYEDKYGGMGVSHYLEHIVCAGSTKDMPEKDVQEILRELGGASNAYTTKDYTCYFINTTPQNFEKAFNLLTSSVFDSAITSEEFERERDVIIKEIERGLDQPERILYKKLDELTYGDHPAAFPVIGYLERFRKIKRDDLLKYYRDRYVPNNVVLVIAGNVSASKILPKVEVALLKYERGPEMNRTLPESSLQLSGKKAEKFLDITKNHYIMSFKTTDIYHEDLYALDLLSEVLSAGESSILQQEVKHDRELVDVISAGSYTPAFAPGYFYIYSILNPDNINAVKHAVLKELRHVKEKGVKKLSVEKAKKMLITNYIFRLRHIERQVSDIGGSYLISGDPFFTKRYLKGILEVKSADLKKVARKYFNENNLIEIAVGKRLEKQEGEIAVKSEVSEVKELNFKNGITLLMKKNTSTPTVAIIACFKGGLIAETKDNSGIFNFMASLMDRGTEEISAAEMAERIDKLGGNVSVSSGSNNVIVSISVLKDELSEGMDILKKILIKANFNGGEVEKQRRLILSEIDRLNDEPIREASIIAREAYFGSHPYGMDLIGSKESIEKITDRNLKELYSEYIKSDNCIIGIFGDINFDKTVKVLDKTLKKKKKDKYREFDIVGFVPDEKPKIVQKKTTKNNAVIIQVYPACGLKGKEYFTFDVIDSLISGIDYPGGWLHQALRSDDKLVYFVHAQFLPRLKTGMFMVVAQTSTDKLKEVLDKINFQVDRLLKKEFTDEELEVAKNICITVHEMGLQTNEEQAVDAILNLRYSRGFDFSGKYPANIRKISRADIEQCIDEYFTKGPITIVTSPEAIEF